MRRTKIHTGRRAHNLLVAETEAERTHGMNAPLPPPYVGMLFGFDPSSTATMTMKNTPRPLQIAFLGPDRTVHTVYAAAPLSGSYSSPKPTQWVIETTLAWGPLLRLGDRVDFVP